MLPADLPKVELEFLSKKVRSPVSAPWREKYKRIQRIEEEKRTDLATAAVAAARAAHPTSS